MNTLEVSELEHNAVSGLASALYKPGVFYIENEAAEVKDKGKEYLTVAAQKDYVMRNCC